MSKAGKKTNRIPVQSDTTPEAVVAVILEEPDALDYSELIGVPFLGAVRAAALANVGILCIADLHAATPEAIGGVKGVGLRNAERIKAWVAERVLAPVETNQEDLASEVPTDLNDIDGAVSRIKDANPKKALDKKLSRQLNKVLSRVSGVPAALESLGGKEKHQAVKALDRIATLLADAAERGRLSDKKQHTVGGAIKARLKKLDKALDD